MKLILLSFNCNKDPQMTTLLKINLFFNPKSLKNPAQSSVAWGVYSLRILGSGSAVSS